MAYSYKVAIYMMKMLLTVITVLVLCTSKLVVASELAVCTKFITGQLCEEILEEHSAFQYVAGYYFNTNDFELMFCGMYQYTGSSCEDIYITIIRMKLLAKMGIIM